MKSLTFLFTCLLVASVSQARIITVDTDGPADFHTIQAAIDDANDGDTVVVNPGTYTGDGNRDIDFKGKAITVASIDPYDANVVAATTIDCNATWTDRRRGFIFRMNEGPDSVLAGLTVINASTAVKVGDWPTRADPTITHCAFVCDRGGLEAQVYCGHGSPDISHCLFKYNKNVAVYCAGQGTRISNCIFAWNTDPCVHIRTGSATIQNCVFWSNTDGAISVEGWHRDDPAQYHTTVTNSILWNNTPWQMSLEYATLTVAYSDVQGGQEAVHSPFFGARLNWDPGNIDANPLFVDPEGEDFHLLAKSPCIDAGDPAHVPAPDDIDIDVEPRMINGRVDMGVDEYSGMDAAYLEVSPLSFEFVANEDGPDPNSQVLSISNLGAGALTWEVMEHCSWLQTEPDSGTLTGEHDYVTLSVDVAGLTWGEYACELAISDPCALNSPQAVSVTLHVHGPVLKLSQHLFEFHGLLSGPSPDAQLLSVWNDDVGILDWQIIEDCYWLEVTPDGGQSSGEKDEVELSVNSGGLPIGDYNCDLTISDPKAKDSPQSVSVALYVRASGSALELHVPSQYSTIRSAVDAAQDGDTVILAGGTYTGHGNRDLDFRGKAITVRSTDPNDPNVVSATIIDSDGAEADPHRAFSLVNGEGPQSVIAGLTIVDGLYLGGSEAAALFCDKASPTITNCIITDNHGGSYGNSIYLRESQAKFVDCVVVANSGCGIRSSGGRPTLLNCTIADNTDGYGVRGGGRLINCIVWGNAKRQVRGGYSIAYCDIEGGKAGTYADYPDTLYWGPGNIDADPCFVDPNNGDYHLLPNSPCINAGDPRYSPVPGETDIDGDPRVIAGRIDMGADEFFFERPLMGISSTKFVFHADKGGPNPQPQILTVCNLGPGTLSWQISEACPWLQVHPNSGKSKGEKDKITLSVDISGMDGGVYRCELAVSDPNAANSPQFVSVTLHLGWIGSGSVLSVPSEYSTIQAAIDQAQNGDTVIVAPATYTGDGNRDIEFAGKSITVRSIDPNDPNIVAATIIDCEGTERDPHRGFYLEGCIHGTVSGLMITRGHAEAGGGIYCKDGSCLILNCQIIGNSTKNGEDATDDGQDGTDGGHGGGIYCCSSSLVLNNCSIRENTSGTGGEAVSRARGGDGGNGGAIYCDGSSLVVLGCNLMNNTTGEGGHPRFSYHGGDAGHGAGVYCTDSVLRIRDCNIAGNKTGDGGHVVDLGDPGDGGDGAGIYGAMTSLIEICDSIVSTNETGDGGCDMYRCDDAGQGGGVYCDSSSALTISNCSISGNRAGRRAHGGGVYCESMLTMTESTVSGNATTSVGYGGGIYCHSAVIEDSTISDNATGPGEVGELELHDDGGAGGGIHCIESLELMRCIISRNRTGPGQSWDDATSGGNGGGVSCGSAIISDCWITDNTTGRGASGYHPPGGHGGDGGGIYCSSQATIINCVVSRNRTGRGGDAAPWAEGNGGDGGAGGGICSQTGTMANCLIAGNRTGNGGLGDATDGGAGGDGGGVSCASGTISNCTIFGNVLGRGGSGHNGGADGPTGRGGGVYCGEDTVVGDSIIWGNWPEQSFGHDCNNTSFCDISDDVCIGSMGNISADPCFVQPGYWADANDPNLVVEPNDPNPVWVMGDYHLSQKAAGQAVDSPCVDAGSDLAVNLGMGQLTTRTDKVGDEGIVDIGYHYCENIADLNDDGKVDVLDLVILASQWQRGPRIPSADIAPISGDGVVDSLDLALLADNWLWEESG